LIRSSSLLAALAIAALNAPTAQAMPGPTCPGNGNDTIVFGASGGWCEYLYMPNGMHVSCRWADWSFLIGDIAGRTECRIVDVNDELAPGSPPWGVFGHWGDLERNPPPPETPPL
jgi:hypothetical protein